MSGGKDVVIIGAGVVGCSIAYHLAKRGIPSSIIEREAIGSRASGKAWAVISYPPRLLVSVKDPDNLYAMPEGETIAHWQGLFWSGYHRLADLALDIQEKGKMDIEFGVTPWTLVATSERTEMQYKGFMDDLKEGGHCEYEWLGPDDLRSVFPRINPKVRGGLTFPQLQVEPYRFTLGLGQAAEAMGAEIRHGDVVGFDTRGGRITSVKLASGKRVEADKVVIAMGPWSGQATCWLGKEIPVHVAMTECLRVRPRKGFPPHSLAADVQILSRVNGDVVLASAEVRSQSQYFEMKSRYDFDSRLSEEVKTMNIEAALELLPSLEEADLVEHRGDLLAYGPSPFYHKPVMGRLPEWENGYIATRFGAFGIQLSIAAGEITADMIADGRIPYRVKHMMEHLSPA
jgi:glycine oxidase